MHAGCFYFQLGNVKPKYRSKLDSIQLVSLAKYTFIEQYGIDKILEPVVADIKKLEKVSCDVIKFAMLRSC